jgi:hypothetical protein
MSIIQSIQNSILLDLSNCQHLYTKLDPKKADWKPAENMRTTLELMQYLCFIGTAFSQHFANAPEDRDAARNNYRELSKWSREAVTFENFLEMIEKEKKDIQAALAGVSDADLSRPVYHMFSGEEHSLLDGLLTVLKYVCAYRHQLFLYAKMNGANINTLDNWYGKDSSAR